jgi:hypothetical protein
MERTEKGSITDKNHNFMKQDMTIKTTRNGRFKEYVILHKEFHVPNGNLIRKTEYVYAEC